MLGFKKQLHNVKWLLAGHLVLAVLVALVFQYGGFWQKQMQNMLYLDKVVYQTQTPYQNLVFTERHLGGGLQSIINFYINGRLQFSSLDEQIYHEFLVHPAMMASNYHEHILIIGGGDGLALREVLKWQPKEVTLIDLDPNLVDLFNSPSTHLPEPLADKISALNQNSFHDPRVNVINDDAFIAIDKLLQEKQLLKTFYIQIKKKNLFLKSLMFLLL